MCISPSLCLTSDLDVLLLGPKASKAQGTLLLAEALLKVGLAGRAKTLGVSGVLSSHP